MLDLQGRNIRAVDAPSFSAGPSHRCFSPTVNRLARRAPRTRHVAMANIANRLEFTKYQGLGNDFILVRVEQLPQSWLCLFLEPMHCVLQKI